MRVGTRAESIEDTSGAKLAASTKGLQRFTESRIGLSVHWGLYCAARPEERGRSTSRADLHWRSTAPTSARSTRCVFSAEEWADLVLEAGLEFVMITSKHHDGFCLWDTPTTDWNVTADDLQDGHPVRVAPALRDRGIPLHFYYSLLDWTRPAYRSDWPAYVTYYQAQVRELCTRSEGIGGIPL